VLVESARIARGQITELSKLSAEDFDAVIFPGGFGAAKNLCNFAITDSDIIINEEVERVLKEFHAAKKPIGMCCISPVLAAKVFPGCKVTIGNDEKVASRIESFKSFNVVKKIDEVQIDKEHLLVTTPAYMYDQPIHRVFEGVTKMVNNTLQLTKQKDI